MACTCHVLLHIIISCNASIFLLSYLQAGVKAVMHIMGKNLQPGEAFQAWINCTECVVNYSTWYNVYQHTGCK